MIGQDQQKFYVHKDLLCDSSEFFKKCLDDPFEEAQTKKVDLQDVRLDAFKIILDYLYNPAFRNITTLDAPGGIQDLIHAWVLADKLLMRDAKNAIMDLIQLAVDVKPGSGCDGTALVCIGIITLQNLDSNVDQDWPIRRFFVDRFAYDLHTACTGSSGLALSNLGITTDSIFTTGGQIVADVMKKLYIYFALEAYLIDIVHPEASKGCKFHEHETAMASNTSVQANVASLPLGEGSPASSAANSVSKTSSGPNRHTYPYPSGRGQSRGARGRGATDSI